MNKKILAGIIASAGVGLVAACGPNHSTALHADVKNSAVQNAAQVEKQRLGIPSNPVGQIAYAHQLLTSSAVVAIAAGLAVILVLAAVHLL